MVSHGSREADWVRLVDDAVSACADLMGSEVPVVSAFLELVEGRLIQDGVHVLEAEGVTDLYVLPLFVSSGSTHVDDIAQAFGMEPVSAARVGELERFVVQRGVRVRFGVPIDDDGDIAELLLRNIAGLSGGRDGTLSAGAERALAAECELKEEVGAREERPLAKAKNEPSEGTEQLSAMAKHETLAGESGEPSESAGALAELTAAERESELNALAVGEPSDGARAEQLPAARRRERLLLVAHGSREAVFHGRWRDGMAALAERVRELGGFAGAHSAMLLPNQAACKLGALQRRYPDDTFIVVPLFLSEGYFTRTVIPTRLAGLNYRYNGRALLPSPQIARWMERQIRKWLSTM
ncbi:CbiX protein [Paenibacillus sp. OV219]|nr:CbiX protein [Paenibacillus sp. OV219]